MLQVYLDVKLYRYCLTVFLAAFVKLGWPIWEVLSHTVLLINTSK